MTTVEPSSVAPVCISTLLDGGKAGRSMLLVVGCRAHPDSRARSGPRSILGRRPTESGRERQRDADGERLRLSVFMAGKLHRGRHTETGSRTFLKTHSQLETNSKRGFPALHTVPLTIHDTAAGETVHQDAKVLCIRVTAKASFGGRNWSNSEKAFTGSLIGADLPLRQSCDN